MSYLKAETVLPKEILMLVQEYADGQYLYIPKKSESRKGWGDNTDTKRQLRLRDMQIYEKYNNGCSSSDLAKEYYLSQKSIQRIILNEKNKVL